MKNMGRLKALLVMVLVGVLLLASPLFGCGAEKPAEKVKVKVAFVYIQDLSGAYASIMAPWAMAREDSVKRANELELVPGVELIQYAYDCASDPAKATAAYKDAMGKTPTPVLWVGSGTPALSPVVELLKRDKLVHLGWTTNPLFTASGAWIWSAQPYYDEMAGAIAKWWKDNRWKENRKPRFTWLTWDTAAGRAFCTKEGAAYLESVGFEFVEKAAAYIPQSPTDTTPQMLILQKEGIDAVTGYLYPPQEAKCINDADRIGLTGHITWLTSPACPLDQVAAMSSIKLVSGHAYWQYPTLLKDEAPDWALNAFKARGYPDTAWAGYNYGLSCLDWDVAALNKTIKMFGVNNITGPNIFKATRTMTNFKSPFNGSALDCSKLICCKEHRLFGLTGDGKLELLDPHLKMPGFHPAAMYDGPPGFAPD